MKKKKAKKVKPEAVDGLGPKELAMVHKAVRQVWSWSRAWRLAKARSVGKDGFPRCENKRCPSKGKPVVKVFVDHIKPVGQVGGPDYIKKMFIPHKGLQCLCKQCHDEKTRLERAWASKSKKQIAADVKVILTAYNKMTREPKRKVKKNDFGF